MFSEALDYQALIDSHYRYLYKPHAEWAKFCKISIFLYTARNYIVNGAKECLETIHQGSGYYHDLLKMDAKDAVISSIGTTNYNNLIEKVVTTAKAIHLNGNVDDYYDPYSNKIQTLNANELKDQDRILVPFIFTQSGIKPLTSIEMSRKYVKLFDQYKDYPAYLIALEFIAVVFGVISVLFAKKNNILVYPTGLVSTILFVYILYKFQLYGDLIINIYYSIMSFLGWYLWSKTKGGHEEFPISTISRKEFVVSSLIFLITLTFVALVYHFF